MNILDRYLSKNFLIPFVICILTFSSLVIVIDLFNRLDELLKFRPSLILLLNFYLHFIPFTFVQTSPVALLVACLYSVGLLNKHHEITAMRASGMSLFRILLPFLALGVLVGVFSFWVNETIVPAAMAKVNFIKEGKLESQKGSSKEKILKNVALFGEGRDLIYASSYDAKRRVLHDLVIFRDDENHVPVLKIQAEEARFAENSWILSRGRKYQLDPKGKLVGEPFFFTKDRFPSSVKPEDLLKAKRQGEMMNFQELRAHIKRLEGKTSPSVIRRLRVELHKKIAYPFSNPMTILIGFPLVFREKRAVGMLRGIGISAALCFSFYVTFVITSNLGLQGILPPWLAVWSANLFFGIGGIVLLWRAR